MARRSLKKLTFGGVDGHYSWNSFWAAHPCRHTLPITNNGGMRTKTTTMNVSLTDALRAVVDERLRSGLYGNASEYVRELIRCDEEAAKQLRAIYWAGIDSGESVPMTDEDWAALRVVARSPGAGQG